MTLQIALLGSDGVLIASDTRKLTTRYDEKTKKEIDVFEHEDKITLSALKTVAAAWSGFMPSAPFLTSVANLFEEKWQSSDPQLKDLWEKEKSLRQDDAVDCRLLIAKSNKREVYKVWLSRDSMRTTRNLESHILEGLPNGHETNSACFFTQRYAPKEPVPIENLVRWAAYYILMGGEINSSGIDGLVIYLSKTKGIFRRISETKILQLMKESNHLDQLISGFLFMSIHESCPAFPQFPTRDP